MNKQWVVLVLLVLGTNFAFAASFDCDKASTKVEKMICADPGLSKLDEELGNAYSNARDTSPAPNELKRKQRDWINARNECGDLQCLYGVYKSRIDVLNKFLLNSKLNTISVASENICSDIKKKLHTIVSNVESINVGDRREIDSYKLSEGVGSPGMFPGVDIDLDGKVDEVSKSCAASLVGPADRCFLTVKNSSGKTYYIDGWGMSLLHYNNAYYLLTHHDDKARSKLFTQSMGGEVIYHPDVEISILYELYRLDAKGSLRVCKDL